MVAPPANVHARVDEPGCQGEVPRPPSASPFAKGGPPAAEELGARIGSAALAFRGYEGDQLGRSKELVDHPAYGPVVRQVLERASGICSDAIGSDIDLVEHVRTGEHGNLANLSRDNATIVAMQIAQLRVLDEFFDVRVERARLSFGFSTGELTALVVGGVFSLERLLEVLTPMARDCGELARDAGLGVVTTRRSPLRPVDVERVCRAVRSHGEGLIGPTAFLSPRCALVVGQSAALARFEEIKGAFLPRDAVFQRKREQWTPLHSPLVWDRNIPNRTAVALHQIKGPLSRPSPPVLSGVTGEASYDELSARELLALWSDHPQRFWDVVTATLHSGVDVIIHVGPVSRLITSTFASLNRVVAGRRGARRLRRFGHAMISGIGYPTWPLRFMPPRLSLWRAPALAHVVLEDWLLRAELPRRPSVSRCRAGLPRNDHATAIGSAGDNT